MNETMWALRLFKSEKIGLSLMLKLRNSEFTLNTCSYHVQTSFALLRSRDNVCEGKSVANVNNPVTCAKTFIGGVNVRHSGLLNGIPPVKKVQLRHKHGKGKRSSRDQDEESDSDEEESDDDSNGGFTNYYEEDEMFPNNYTEIKKNVKSLRLDNIVSAGLNISRNKVDEYFLSSKLLLNGEKVLKKSKQMTEGDSVDLISEAVAEEENKMKVKRVRIAKVDDNKTSKGKLTVYLRCWRGNVLVDKVEHWSPRSKKTG